MRKIVLYILLTGTLLSMEMLFTGCSKEHKVYKKLAIKGTVAEKDSAAVYFYNRGEYERAAFLFEELMGYYRANSRFQDMLYYLAYSRFNQKLYIEAAQYFDQFVRQFPNEPRAEECGFVLAVCYYNLALPYYLEQAPTLKALDQFQYFIASFPSSEKIKECDTYMIDLRERLARKAFEQAKLYYKIGNYKAGVAAFEAMTADYPDSKFRQEALFLWFKSAVLLADNSIPSKKKNRYLDALDLYRRFVDTYPQSEFMKEAQNLFDRAKKELENLAKATGSGAQS